MNFEFSSDRDGHNIRSPTKSWQPWADVVKGSSVQKSASQKEEPTSSSQQVWRVKSDNKSCTQGPVAPAQPLKNSKPTLSAKIWRIKADYRSGPFCDAAKQLFDGQDSIPDIEEQMVVDDVISVDPVSYDSWLLLPCSQPSPDIDLDWLERIVDGVFVHKSSMFPTPS